MWHCAGVSVVGERHLRKGLPCEDACYASFFREHGLLVLLAADGAGLSRQGGVGARATVDAVAGLFPGLLSEFDDLVALGLALVARARAALEVLASEGSRLGNLTDYATTFLCVLVVADRLVAIQVGDGFIVEVLPTEMHLLFQPSKGRYANETVFLTSFDSFDALREAGEVQVVSKDVSDALGFAVLTDGLEAAAIRSSLGKPHVGFFKTFFESLGRTDRGSFERGLQAFFTENEQLAELTDDDLTLLLAIRSDKDFVFSGQEQKLKNPKESTSKAQRRVVQLKDQAAQAPTGKMKELKEASTEGHREHKQKAAKRELATPQFRFTPWVLSVGIGLLLGVVLTLFVRQSGVMIEVSPEVLELPPSQPQVSTVPVAEKDRLDRSVNEQGSASTSPSFEDLSVVVQPGVSVNLNSSQEAMSEPKFSHRVTLCLFIAKDLPCNPIRQNIVIEMYLKLGSVRYRPDASGQDFVFVELPQGEYFLVVNAPEGYSVEVDNPVSIPSEQSSIIRLKQTSLEPEIQSQP